MTFARTEAGGARGERLPWALGWRLAVGQTLSWGVLYYAFAMVVGPMHAATGWSRAFLNLGLSTGLLVWGLCTLPVGRWLQRRGARGLMVGATLLGGASLVLMGLLVHPLVYLLAWVGLGVAMAGVLYEPAFAVVMMAFGPHYRRGIVLITLVAGFASTLFLPLAQGAVEHVGWARTLLLLGLGQVLVCGPLYYWTVPPVTKKSIPSPRWGQSGRWVGGCRLFRWREATDLRMVGVMIWFAAYALGLGGFIFVLVPMLQAPDVEEGALMRALVLVGPMQVVGRLLLARGPSGPSALAVGPWALGALVLAMGILVVLPKTTLWLSAFAICFGAGNGVMTVLRGTVVAELFDRERYAELNGVLAMPAVLAKAASPLLLAAIWSSSGSRLVVWGVVLAWVIVAFVGLLIARRGAAARTAPGGIGGEPALGDSEVRGENTAAPSAERRPKPTRIPASFRVRRRLIKYEDH